MMTFADRERTIEAYYAARELAEFLKRSQRWLELGFQSAEALNLHGADARLFATQLCKGCIAESSDNELYRRLAKTLAGRRLQVTDTNIRHTEPSREQSVAASPERPWAEFVANELLALFGADRKSASTPAAHPQSGLAH
jgi:hypothetical protein